MAHRFTVLDVDRKRNTRHVKNPAEERDGSGGMMHRRRHSKHDDTVTCISGSARDSMIRSIRYVVAVLAFHLTVVSLLHVHEPGTYLEFAQIDSTFHTTRSHVEFTPVRSGILSPRSTSQYSSKTMNLCRPRSLTVHVHSYRPRRNDFDTHSHTASHQDLYILRRYTATSTLSSQTIGIPSVLTQTLGSQG